MLAANLSMAEQCTMSASPKSLHHSNKGHQQAANVTVQLVEILKLPQQQVATAANCHSRHFGSKCLHG